MTDQTPQHTAVLGAGSWGTALAALMARHGHQVTLWGRDQQAIEEMKRTGQNTGYLPGFDLPENITYTSDLAEAVTSADMLMIVVPSHAFTDVCAQVAKLLPKPIPCVWATKGFEQGSGRFLHEVVREHFGHDIPTAIVTGPSFAKEVVQGQPTAVTVHSEDNDFAHMVANMLHGETFRAYTGNDVLGAELGGAMKNVLAVATGAADGMGLGLNTRAGLITRGLNEMLRLNDAMGGKAETLIGLAGLGDLVLTCTGDLSRNRRLGYALGQGQSIDEAVKSIGQAVESIRTVDEVMRLAERHGVELPISAMTQKVLHEELTPKEALEQLLARMQKAEYVSLSIT